jgi:hypothetical protein
MIDIFFDLMPYERELSDYERRGGGTRQMGDAKKLFITRENDSFLLRSKRLLSSAFVSHLTGEREIQIDWNQYLKHSLFNQSLQTHSSPMTSMR